MAILAVSELEIMYDIPSESERQLQSFAYSLENRTLSYDKIVSEVSEGRSILGSLVNILAWDFDDIIFSDGANDLSKSIVYDYHEKCHSHIDGILMKERDKYESG